MGENKVKPKKFTIKKARRITVIQQSQWAIRSTVNFRLSSRHTLISVSCFCVTASDSIRANPENQIEVIEFEKGAVVFAL